jgi:transcriptional regulator of aromatic amino acid metabolism
MMIHQETNELIATLLQNNLLYIENNRINLREISSDRIKVIYLNTPGITMRVFKFLVELMKTNPPVIVDIEELKKNPTEYIENFYTKKNQ